MPTRRSTYRTIVVQLTTVFTSNKGLGAHLPVNVRDELIEGCCVKFVGRRSTLGPRWVNRGSPIFGGHPWVPAEN